MSNRKVSEQRSLPARRRGLDAVFIKYVVRNGIGSMPPQTRVDVTNAELEAIVAYLGLPGAERRSLRPKPGRVGIDE